MAVSGRMDAAVSGHGYGKLSCLYLGCVGAKARKGADGIRRTACSKFLLAGNFLFDAALSGLIHMAAGAVDAYSDQHGHVSLHPQERRKAYASLPCMGNVRGLSKPWGIFAELGKGAKFTRIANRSVS